MINGLLHGFRHYFDFSGRDSRSLFWGFIISTQLITIVPLALPVVIAFMFEMCEPLQSFFSNMSLLDCDELADYASEFFGAYFADSRMLRYVYVYSLGAATLWWVLIFIPTIAATVRRLRDAGQSPWWALSLFLCHVPAVSRLACVLSVVTLILCCFNSCDSLNSCSASTRDK